MGYVYYSSFRGQVECVGHIEPTLTVFFRGKNYYRGNAAVSIMDYGI